MRTVFQNATLAYGSDHGLVERLGRLVAEVSPMPGGGGGGDGGGGGNSADGRVAEWRGVSAMEVSAQMRVGLLIAEEYLLGAEAKGLLARDDTVEGLYFYRNEFFMG